MITLTINGVTITRDLPEVYRHSSGPMSMHSALIGTVSRMLEHLCSELAKQQQPSVAGIFGEK